MSIENDDIDLGKAIFSPAETKKSPSDTKTSYGIAKSDSSDGTVTVDMLGLTSGESQEVEMPCTCSVEEGQRVIVTIVGSDPIVTGVAGWGDLVRDDAKEALSTAKIAIKAVDVEYALGDSQTAAPTTGWTTTAPEWQSGKYIWQRTVTYTSESSSYSDPTCIQGAKGEDGTPGKDGADGSKGEDGVGVKAIVEQYYLSTSSTTQTGGSWSTSQPSWSEGKYIWTRSQVTWTNNTVTTTTPVLAKAINNANEIASDAQNRVAEQETLVRVRGDGVEIARKVDGSYTSSRTVVSDTAFVIEDTNGNELARYSSDLVELGKNSESAAIRMLAGALEILTEKVPWEQGTYTSTVIDGSNENSVGLFVKKGNVSSRIFSSVVPTSSSTNLQSEVYLATAHGGDGTPATNNSTSINSYSSSSGAYIDLMTYNTANHSSAPIISLQNSSSVSRVTVAASNVRLGQNKDDTISILNSSNNLITYPLSRLETLLWRAGSWSEWSKYVYVGTVVVSGGGDTAALVWTPTQFKNAFGVTPTETSGKYFVAFMNGDGGASAAHVQDATFISTGIHATFDRAVSGNLRLNYLVVVYK